MSAPGTFSHAQTGQWMSSQCFDINKLAAVFTQGDYAKDRRELAQPLFGFRSAERITERSIQTLEQVFAGQLPQYDQRIWRNVLQINEDAQLQISDIDIKLIEHMGLHVGACILLAMIADQCNSSNYEPLTIINHDGSGQTNAEVVYTSAGKTLHVSEYHLNKDVTWRHYSLMIDNLPSTIVGALKGKKMKEVISHPVIDQYDIGIIEVAAVAHTTLVYTDFLPSMIPINALAQDALAKLQAA